MFAVKISSLGTTDHSAGVTCGTTDNNDLEKLVDKMTMNKDFHCYEERSEPKSGAAI